MEEAKTPKKLAKMKVDESTVQSMWDLFAEEYDIPEDHEMKGDDNQSQILMSLKKSWLRMLRAGKIEIVSDANDGVVVKQYLAHRIEGISSDPQCINWKAPTVSIIAQARMGTRSSEETPSIQQWQKYAASATGVNEALLLQLRGGDQSRMAAIAQLFISA